MISVLAFDLGASSGRAIKADYDNGILTYNEVHRFEISPMTMDDGIHHNIDALMSEIKEAVSLAGHVDALAFDTWGVDYALLDENNNLINEPFHYRDSRTAKVLEKAEQTMPLKDLYSETGNQVMNINTLFQLLCDEKVKDAKKLLFLPDLFAFLLCGNAVCEKTIASTSQMLNPVTGEWSADVLEKFGISKDLFAPLTKSATVCGEYEGIKVISVAGHDTQCAVAAMPVTSENAAFLSCGTWSLIGCELDEPMLNEARFYSELSNEIGVNGKVDYLKNISGLWLIQEMRRDLRRKGQIYSFNDLEQMAKNSEPFLCFIDPDDPSLSAPGSLPDKIKAYCEKTEQEVPESVGETVRCIYESLALKYRLAMEQISGCTGKNFYVLHILGGGTKDAFLCQMTADCLNIPVIAGPNEATALGNVILQLIALGALPDIDSGRQLVAQTESLKNYVPERNDDWDDAYMRFKSIIQEVK